LGGRPASSNWPSAPSFRDLVSTYGKSFHAWQIDRDDFPYGVPRLMIGFTQDGQIDEILLEARDRRFGISWKQKRKHRADAPTPAPIAEANFWEGGASLQTDIREVALKRRWG
jgi:hypothetical protein